MDESIKDTLNVWEKARPGRAWTAWGSDGGYTVCLIAEDGYKMRRLITPDDELGQVRKFMQEATDYEESP